MEPVKVVFGVNGATFICTDPEQLKSFLSSGWSKVEKPKQPRKKKTEK